MNCRHLVLCVCAGALLGAASSSAPAQAIYRQLDPGGRVIYTDRPDTTLPGGAEIVASAPVSAAPAATEPEPAPVLRRTLISPLRSAAIDAREAARRLLQARLNREHGVAPLPGERLHGAGQAAFSPRYWQRQEQLRREVEMALRRSNETQLMLLATR